MNEKRKCGTYIPWMLPRNIKEQIDMCNKVDESHQHNFKEKKLHKEEYMVCDFTYKSISKIDSVRVY